MTTSRTAMAIGCFLLLLTGAALAESSASPFSKLKPMTPIGASENEKAPNYLGASMGSTTTAGFCDGLANCDNSDKSWKAYAGIRMNDNLVLEGGYVDFGKQTGADTNGEVSQQASAFTAAGVAGVPISDQIEVFGKAGLARWTVEQTDSTGSAKTSSADVLVGVGASYDLGDNMGVRAEWERFKDVGGKTGRGSDIDLMSLGLTFSSL